MAETSRPSTSTNNPPSSQVMPEKLAAKVREKEAELNTLKEVMKARLLEKEALEKSVVEKKAMVRSTQKEIRRDERAIKLIEEECTNIEDELRDINIFLAEINDVYPN